MAGQFDHLKKKKRAAVTPDSFIDDAVTGTITSPNSENNEVASKQPEPAIAEETKKKGRPRKEPLPDLLITTKGRHNRKTSEVFNLYLPKEIDKEISQMTAGNKQLVLNYLVKTAWDSVKRKGKIVVVDAEEITG